MTTQIPRVQIFKDVPEEVSGVSLGRDPSRGIHVALMRFQALASLEHFLSFRKSSANVMHLIDTEGEITIKPSGIKLFYGGPEKEDLKGIECKLEIDRDDHWERFLRFMHRYAEANELAFGETESA